MYENKTSYDRFWNGVPKRTKVYAFDEFDDDWIEAELIRYYGDRERKRFLVEYKYTDDWGDHIVLKAFNYCSLNKK